MMLSGSLVTPDDATQPTTSYLIRKSDKVVLGPVDIRGRSGLPNPAEL
jgi:hypothetical protein